MDKTKLAAQRSWLQNLHKEAREAKDWVLYDLIGIALADQDAQVNDAIESAEEETIRLLQDWAMKTIQEKIK